MNPDEVAHFLRNNPTFFEQHAEVLSQITVPSPHGGQAIPLSERQVAALRDRVRVLEGKLAEMIRFGEENDAISEKVHRLSLALVIAGDLDAVLSTTTTSLREDFGVPHVGLRLWRGEGSQPEFGEVSDELRRYAEGLAHPFCGANANFEAAGWFGAAADHVRSIALVSLRDSAGVFGLLVLAAEDPERFYPEMGTLYIERIGELAAAAITREL